MGSTLLLIETRYNRSVHLQISRNEYGDTAKDDRAFEGSMLTDSLKLHRWPKKPSAQATGMRRLLKWMTWANP